VSADGGPDERTRRIIDVVMALGEGEVTTYGDIADVAGYPRNARLVGRILRTTDDDVPWWRVVGAGGHLKAHDPVLQTGLLRAEGVVVRGTRVLDAPIGRFAHPEQR
jgi:methylated-DNA-protein-cysteine methyltransferase-like protein